MLWYQSLVGQLQTLWWLTSWADILPISWCFWCLVSPRNVYHRWHHVITPKYSSEILRYFGCQGGMDVTMWVDSMGKAASSMWQGCDCPIPYGDLISRASYFMLISGRQMKVQSRARNVIGLVGLKLRHSKRTHLQDRDKMAANLQVSNSKACFYSHEHLCSLIRF